MARGKRENANGSVPETDEVASPGREHVIKAAKQEAEGSSIPETNVVAVAAPPPEKRKPPKKFVVGARVVCFRHGSRHGVIKAIDGKYLDLYLDGPITVETGAGDVVKTRKYRIEKSYCRLTMEPGPPPTQDDMAAALRETQDENERLKAEIEQLKKDA